jgi:hypothetical protein
MMWKVLLAVTLIFSSTCAPKVSTVQFTPALNAKESNCELDTYIEGRSTPDRVKVIGEIKVGDTGLSVNCDADTVLGIIRKKACAAGADAIYLSNIIPPGERGTCFWADAQLLLYEERPTEIDRSLSTGSELLSDWSSPTPPEPHWTAKFESKIKWVQIYGAASLIVGGDRSLTGISLEDGRKLWHLASVDSESFEPLGMGRYATVWLLHEKSSPMAVIDVTDGRVLWTTEGLGLKRVYGHFFLPPIEAVMIFGRYAEEPENETVLVLASQTGEMLWESEDFLARNAPPSSSFLDREKLINGNQPPLFDSEETMIVFLDRRAISKYNARTGSLTWWRKEELTSASRIRLVDDAAKSNAAKPLYGYAYMTLARTGDRFYAPYGNTVSVFSTETGERLWKEDPLLPGIVIQMEETDAGLVVQTRYFNGEQDDYNLLLLDRSSGEIKWSTKLKGSLFKSIFSAWPNCTNFVVQDDRILVAAAGKLWAIDLGGGKMESLAKIDYEGSEEQFFLMESNLDSIIVVGYQNFFLFGPDGSPRYHVYHDPPDGFERGFRMLVTSMLLRSSHATRLFSHPGRAIEEMLRDYMATTVTDEFVYMLRGIPAEEHSTVALMKIDQDTGLTVGKVVVKMKQPKYVVDEARNRVIIKSGKKKLSCYGF